MATKIDWVKNKDGTQGKTWNPTTGCTKVSAGCKNCYAERMAKRLKAMGQPRYRNGFELTMHCDKICEPFNRKKPTTYFVNSMSDLFHEGVSDCFIQDVFKVMNASPEHTYIILTKRSLRLRRLSNKLLWTKNIWMGVSIEKEEYIYRMQDLKETGAHVKLISFEPLIGRVVSLKLDGIDWVIVGGETGPGARDTLLAYYFDILEACRYQGIPFFYKGQGTASGRKKKAWNYHILEGKEWQEMPKAFYE
jgi:protein gp37